MSAEWPSEAQVRVWQNSDSPVERVMGEALEKIMAGQIPAGYGLPTDEFLAEAAHVTPADARAAKRRLADMGIIRSAQDRFVVCERPPEGRM